MKNIKFSAFKQLLLPSILLIMSSCGGGSEDQPNEGSANVDVCKCLTMPGNSTFMQENADACRDAISAELGVDNWEQVNMSENPIISEKFDQLAARCTGSEIQTSDENTENEVPQNEFNSAETSMGTLYNEIGTGSGYVWELIDQSSQIYVTLAFDKGFFRNDAYNMNGQMNSEDFIPVINFKGTWSEVNDRKAEGTISSSGVDVSWNFSSDFKTCTNNKGAVYTRVKVK